MKAGNQRKLFSNLGVFLVGTMYISPFKKNIWEFDTYIYMYSKKGNVPSNLNFGQTVTGGFLATYSSQITTLRLNINYRLFGLLAKT